jgi:hypothetical protein
MVEKIFEDPETCDSSINTNILVTGRYVGILVQFSAIKTRRYGGLGLGTEPL